MAGAIGSKSLPDMRDASRPRSDYSRHPIVFRKINKNVHTIPRINVKLNSPRIRWRHKWLKLRESALFANAKAEMDGHFRQTNGLAPLANTPTMTSHFFTIFLHAIH
jgi:hypothetical protein